MTTPTTPPPVSALTADRLRDLVHQLTTARASIEALTTSLAESVVEREDILTKDRIKTREINVLTHENIELHAKLVTYEAEIAEDIEEFKRRDAVMEAGSNRIVEMAAQIEALRANDARYRWLREYGFLIYPDVFNDEEYEAPIPEAAAKLDAAIDDELERTQEPAHE